MEPARRPERRFLTDSVSDCGAARPGMRWPHETSFAPTRSVLSANARPTPGRPSKQEKGHMRAISRVLLAAVILTWPGALCAQQIDWQRVDDAIAKPGVAQGDVRRYELPRSDL